jgi:hypothetical protein
MTPNERLDQLEPLLADSLQKIDRLIEGQGKLIDLATNTQHQLDITAKGLGNLTVSTQRQYEELKVGQEAIMQYLREKLP